jgi:hypothetical protein
MTLAALAIPSVAKATPHIITLVARLKSRPLKAITFSAPSEARCYSKWLGWGRRAGIPMAWVIGAERMGWI